MEWLAEKQRLLIARRIVALAALVSFTVANIGWPQTLGKSGGPTGNPKLAAQSDGAGCCCGPKAGKSSCGCCKRPVLAQGSVPATAGGCCQKKNRAPEKSPVPVLHCGCGDSS